MRIDWLYDKQRASLRGNVEVGFTQVVAALGITCIIVTVPFWGWFWLLGYVVDRQEKTNE